MEHTLFNLGIPYLNLNMFCVPYVLQGYQKYLSQ